MKRLLTLISIFAVALNAIAADYVVTLTDTSDPDVVTRFHGVGPKQQGNGKQALWKHALRGFAATLNDAQLSKLQKDSRVLSVEPDVTVNAFAQTIPTGVRRIGCLSNSLWQASNITPINADIAIIDTGIDLTHPDLNVVQNVTFVTNTVTGNDDNGHGSHCAGIAAAKNDSNGVVGVAPGARLWAVKVLDASGSGQLSSIISGVNYVAQNAASIEVANMSLGGQGSSSALHTAIVNAVNAGVVFVVAAGNSAFDIFGNDLTPGTADDFFPASYSEVCTVSALADSDGLPGGIGPTTGLGLDDTLATFTNFAESNTPDNPVFSPGAKIDVAAPGVNIYSTYKNGGYNTLSGTSMASPHVAGVAALYCVQYGRATTGAGVAAIRQAIVAGAEPQNAWGVNNPNPFPYDHNPERLAHADTLGTAPDFPAIKLLIPPNYYSTGGSTLYAGPGSLIPLQAVVQNSSGTTTANLWWYDSLTGFIATGTNIAAMSFANGDHYITAKATNAAGNSAYAVGLIHSSTVGTPPVLTLITPANGSTTNSSTINFQATSIDSLDGDISAGIAWTAQFYGSLGTGSNITHTFPTTSGTISVTAVSTNSANNVSSTNFTVSISSVSPPPSTNNAPVLSVSSPLSGAKYYTGDTVKCVGSATDVQDGDISGSIKWTLDGVSIGTGTNVTTSPTVGTHTIVAGVTDSGGLIASTSRSITVCPSQTYPIVVTITTSPANAINKQKVAITVTVRQNSLPVANASVSAQVVSSRNKATSFSGTTSSAGTVTFYYTINSKSNGTGSYSVTASASTGGCSVGNGTGTFTVIK